MEFMNYFKGGRKKLGRISIGIGTAGIKASKYYDNNPMIIISGPPVGLYAEEADKLAEMLKEVAEELRQGLDVNWEKDEWINVEQKEK